MDSEAKTELALPTFEKLHGRPITRRDFLASGLIPFSASAIMPTWLNLFAKAGVAEAADLVCTSAAGGDMAPFITLKLSGGAGLSSNYVPLDQNKQLLPSYTKIGLGKGSSLRTVLEFSNNVPFYVLSGILAGVRTSSSAETRLKTAFVGVPVRSQDDSSGNKFDISGMVAKAGVQGKILPNLGRVNSETGLNANYALLRPAAPLVVSRFEDVAGSLGVSGSLSKLSQLQKEKLFSAVNRMTASQAKAIENMSGGKTLSRLIQCANIGNESLIANSTSQNISPLGNPAFATVWGINANTSTSSQDFVFATMVFNALNGNAGTINLDIGGYDYHDGTRTSGDTRDTAAGVVIGRILESFAVMGKKGFLVVCSDGSVASSESEIAGAEWTSDRGTGGSMYMLAYDPSMAPSAKATQLGHFTDGQVADDTFITGGSAEKAAAAIFANYMNFNKKVNQVETIIPRTFSTAELDKILIVS
ncbi:MAG: hypothetical protein IPK04_12510 [Bdellovibrionales bacterium]|nr:hypothetical protein [Bdellovibrionales bacterium]